MPPTTPAVPPMPRPRLLDPLEAALITFVDAPAGYGKSTLADALVERLGIATLRVDLAAIGPGAGAVMGALRRGAAMAGLAALAEALAEPTADPVGDAAADAVRTELARRPDPVLLVVDDVQHATEGGDRLLAGVIASAPATSRVLVLGRSIPDALVAAAPDALRLAGADLAFTTDEILAMATARGVALDDMAASRLRADTDGWPAAIAVAIPAHGRGAGPGPTGLERSMMALLEAMGPELAADAAAVAGPPLLDDTVAAIVARPDSLVRLRDAGLPFRRRSDRWQELPQPVRARLVGAVPPPRVVAAVAGAYLDAGEVHVAVAWLRSHGDPETLAAVLAGHPGTGIEALDAAELRALLAGVPEEVLARHPRLLLRVARAAESGVHLAWRAELLARAATAAEAADDAPLRRAVLAEQAADVSRAGDLEAAMTLAGAALAGAGPGEARTRAIALTAQGRALAFSREPAAMVDAAGRLAEAAALLRPSGEPDLLRGTLQVLGYGIHFARGDLDAAADALREAADVGPGAIRTRAGVQTFLADALVAAGAFDEAEVVLRDVLGVARRLGDHRLLGYHAWMQAGIASRRGDVSAVEAWLAEAERHPADWFAHPTGIEFLADAVDHLGRVGEHAAAARYLARVETRCAADGRPGIDQIALVARAIHGARAGDPTAAERDLVSCLSIEQVAPREHWRIHLLRALAADRAEDGPLAARHARRAFHGAAALGHPELPRLLEAGIVERLAPLLSTDPGRPADGSVAPRRSVRTLGRFGVTVDGRPSDPPDGKPSQLVKLLAITGRQVPIDEVVEVLWPDADPDLGRQRLRNVIARIRTACGELVMRDEEALMLDPTAEVDLERFEAAARVALQAGGTGDEALLRAALARHAGELLPADRYEEFTAAARERVALRHVALLDRLALVAAARGDVDEALSLVEEAIGEEPLDERRYRTAIDIAVRHGRRDRAIRLVERAIAMELELADAPSPELLETARTLGLRAEGRRR